MSSRIAGAWAGQLDQLLKRGAIASAGEGQLLERFAKTQDEAAFAAIIARHGPMVLGVCRRVLRDEHDVEDAFQATFLVLVRRANGIRNGDLVGHWLHGVAHRVAVRARAHAARRFVREKTGFDEIGAFSDDESGDVGFDETRSVLDEELGRLPQSLRAPMVLCYLEGLTHDEAARRLGWPVGTVRSRMARARDLLRQRLSRRGLVASSILPARPFLLHEPSQVLLDATIEASLAFARHQAASSALISSTAGVLANGVIHAMTLSKIKLVAGLAVAACALSVGGYQTYGKGSGTENEPNASAVAAAQPGDKPEAINEALDKLQKELAASSKRNNDLQNELKQLQDELKALRVSSNNPAHSQEKGQRKGVDVRSMSRARSEASSSSSSTPKAVTKPNRAMGGMMGGMGGGMGGMGMMGGMGGGMGAMGMMGGMGGGMGAMGGMMGGPAQNRLNYISNGSLIVIPSPEGDQVTAYSTETGTQEALRLFDSKEPERKVIPLVTKGVAALAIEGPEISRIAVYNSVDGKWYPQDLKEPVEGATPVFVDEVGFYGLGRYVYAFSAEAKRWAVLTLPEGADATPVVQNNAVLVDHDGHLYVFSKKIGKWVDIDTRSDSKAGKPANPQEKD
ncbi:sigma-70 family RNA polymerase sigma factor [Singulisphaera sp. PoT]|uniref:sigma-70 family RNA polymerase sigma factor n=1 Tax=Singulisphaera sp. PoT TaxID=3411797 RepID=UPI003BF58F00